MRKSKERAGLKVTYDPEADVLAINLRPLKESLGAAEVSQDHYLHLDAKGRLVSIEILRASEHYGRTPNYLDNRAPQGRRSAKERRSAGRR